jgi:hypothetical protein
MALAAGINTQHVEKFQSLKTLFNGERPRDEEMVSGRILWARREN